MAMEMGGESPPSSTAMLAVSSEAFGEILISSLD